MAEIPDVPGMLDAFSDRPMPRRDTVVFSLLPGELR